MKYITFREIETVDVAQIEPARLPVGDAAGAAPAVEQTGATRAALRDQGPRKLPQQLALLRELPHAPVPQVPNHKGQAAAGHQRAVSQQNQQILPGRAAIGRVAVEVRALEGAAVGDHAGPVRAAPALAQAVPGAHQAAELLRCEGEGLFLLLPLGDHPVPPELVHVVFPAELCQRGKGGGVALLRGEGDQHPHAAGLEPVDALHGPVVCMETHDDRALLLCEGSVFEVVSYKRSWDRMVPYVPDVILTTLLPFDDEIAFDGFLQRHTGHAEGHGVQRVQREFEEACERGIIRDSTQFVRESRRIRQLWRTVGLDPTSYAVYEEAVAQLNATLQYSCFPYELKLPVREWDAVS